MAKLPTLFDTLVEKLTKAVPGFETIGKAVQKAGAPFDQMNKGLSSIGKIGEKIVAPFTAMQAGVQKVTESMIKFVEAFNPALVNLLNLSLRDLNAVMGQAFAPALREVIAMIQEMSATLQPVMLELGGAFGDIYDALTDFISILMNVLSPVLEAVVPIYHNLADALKGIIASLTPVFVLLKALFSFLAPIVTAIAQVVSPAIQFLARAATLAGAALLKFFGQVEMVRQMADMIDPEKEKDRKRLAGFAAVQNVGFTDAQNYGKQMMLSAASAGIGRDEGKRSSEDWLKQLSTDVRQVGDGNFQAFDTLRRDVLDALNKLGDRIIQAVGKQAYEAAGTVGSYVDPREWTYWGRRQLGFDQGGAAGAGG